MSFVQTTQIGIWSNENEFLGPLPSNGGFISPTVACRAGLLVLMAVSIQGVSTIADAGLTVTDSQGNTWTAVGQIGFGDNLLAIFGSVLATTLTAGHDFISFQTTTNFIQCAMALSASNVTLNLDLTAQAVSSGTSPASLAAGTPDATFGDVFFGFTGYASGFGFGTPSITGWDTPSIGQVFSFNDDAATSIGIFGSETFSKAAQTYNPTFTESSTFGSIVLGFTPVKITAAMAPTERTDHAKYIAITEADPIPPQLPGPFFFAYVDNDAVPFDPFVHNVTDEDVFSLEIKHDEGQVPVATVIIKNPRVGLLGPSRKQWAYISYQPEDPDLPVTPLFLGVLVGIPSDLFAELVTLQFNARADDYIERKQATAETLKVAPFYDPVFLDLTHRDDADAILEGWSRLYHTDRVTLDVTASDILEGEDGTVEFDESSALYDSVKMSLGECPLTTIQVQADVKWTQRCIGYLTGPSAHITSFTGGSFKSDWPKPGANIGGGWKVETSFVIDVLDTEHAHTYSVSSNWKNNDPTAGDCSTATMSYNATLSSWPGIGVEGTGSRMEQIGICDPYAFPTLSSTTPGVNIPAKFSVTGTNALEWILNCTWSLRYDAKRDFTELLVFNLTANLQPTLVAPTVDQNTELLKVSGADVGQPMETPFAWSDFAGQEVDIATLIFPNDPTTPGGTSYQICVGAGIAGSVEPVFSDIPGTLTLDGSVIWASLGETPPQTQPEWTNSTPIAEGEIVIIEPKVFVTTTGDMQTTGASYFFLCVGGGETNSTYTSFEYLPDASSTDDGPAQPVPFSVILGPGDSAMSNIGGGGSGAPIPGVGGQTQDGTVTWVNLGTAPSFLGIPIGGTMTNVTARSYYPTTRGQQSIEYLICKARARLRLRSRAVKIEWDAPFDECIGLSCRQNATLFDPRLPGGAATGKITAYTLSADKDGKLLGHVEIGVSVGEANSVPEITGIPEWAQDGYAQVGYQAYDGGQFTTAEQDVAYTPPVFAPYDDGLSFPLQAFPGTLTITKPIQNAQIVTAMATMGAPGLGNVPATAKALGSPGAPGSQLTLMNNQSAVSWLEGGEGTYLIECDPVAAEVLIQPVTNGPFNGAYFVEVTPLELPKGIDLSAESSP